MKQELTYKNIYAKLEKRTAKYAVDVRNLFLTRFGEIASMCEGVDVPDDEVFRFNDYPEIATKVQENLRKMYSELYQLVRGNIVQEWNYANNMTDRMVKQLFGKEAEEQPHFAKYFQRNKQAMDAFFERRQQGLSLSQRIWQYVGEAKEELELAIDLGLGEGKDAAALSRDVRKYLQDPDKLFRRVRDKHGNLVLSQAAKAYHPGQGKYRSSYKNAMRLARTETNMAYRAADITRYQQLPFVLGYEIKMSKKHPYYDICDELAGKYPVQFMWKGWHPHCFCYMVPLLCTDQELEELTGRILDGTDDDFVPAGVINKVPAAFTDWIDNNAERIANAKNMPYFIHDNYKGGDITKGFSFTINIKEPKVVVPNKFAPASFVEEAVSRAKQLGISNVDFGEATLDEVNVVLEVIEQEARAAKLELDGFYIRKDLKKTVYGAKAKGDIGGCYIENQNALYIELNDFRKSIYAKPLTWQERIASCEQKIKSNNDAIAKYESKLGKSKAFDKELKGYIKELKWQNMDFEKRIADYQAKIKAGVASRSATYAQRFEDIKQQAKAQIHHEFGHYVDAKMGRPKYNERIAGVSDYADTSRGERFAEWYAKYRMHGKDGIPADVLQIFEEYEGKYTSKLVVSKKTIAEIAEERHAKRDAKAIQAAWDERKALNKAKEVANNVLGAYNKKQFYTAIDIKELEKALAGGTSTDVQDATKKLAKAMAKEQKEYRLAVKAADDMITEADSFAEFGVDGYSLKLSIKSCTTNEIKHLTKALEAEISTAKQSIDASYGYYIDNPVAVYKAHGKDALDKLYQSVDKKMQQWLTDPWNGSDLNWLKKKLEFEIDYVAKKKAYDTWSDAVAAYTKQLTIVEKKIKLGGWQAEVDDAVKFAATTKSKKVKQWVDELQNMLAVDVAKLDTDAVRDKLDVLNKEIERLKKARKKVALAAGELENLSKTECERMYKEFAASDLNTTDAEMRALTKKLWATLTEDEKYVLTKYTQTYNYLNEPLRGITYYGSVQQAEYVNDLPILTAALQKMEMPRNMCVRRGVDSYPIKELGKDLGELQAGDQFVEGGFLSTACNPKNGLFCDYELVIAVPKGAKGVYAEPFTHYNDFYKYDFRNNVIWDGITDEVFGSEIEWIGQRGAKFEVVKKVGKTIYLKIIAQLS